jgi:hypothetical protein
MLALSRRKLVSASSYFYPRSSSMTTVLAGSARLRQTFFVDGVASRAVSVCFYSRTVRSDGSTFLAYAIMRAKAPK